MLDLKPYRQTFAAKILWWPLTEGWETKPIPAAAATGAMTLPDALFESRSPRSTKSTGATSWPFRCPIHSDRIVHWKAGHAIDLATDIDRRQRASSPRGQDSLVRDRGGAA